MERPKRWQLAIIVIVILLTLYNILPTLFYYSKSLDKPVDKEQSKHIAHQIVERVDGLKNSSMDWVKAYTTHLGLKIKEAVFLEDTQFIKLTFSSEHNAALFKKYLTEAGIRIPFVPAQLKLAKEIEENSLSSVVIQRQIGMPISTEEVDQFFTFSFKRSSNNELSPFYKDLMRDRQEQLALGFAGTSINYLKLNSLIESSDKKQDNYKQELIELSRQVREVGEVFGENSSVAQRYFASFTQGLELTANAKLDLIAKWIADLKEQLFQGEELEKNLLIEQKKRTEEGKFLTADEQRALRNQKSVNKELSLSLKLVTSKKTLFASGTPPLNLLGDQHSLENIEIGNKNPFVKEIKIEPASEQLIIVLHQDLEPGQNKSENREYYDYLEGKAKGMIVSEIARVAQRQDEKFTPKGEGAYSVSLSELNDSESLLALNLKAFAQARTKALTQFISQYWLPQHRDFQPDVFPVLDYEDFQKLSPEQQNLGLYFYSPVGEERLDEEHYFRPQSIYVVSKGLHTILEKYDAYPESEESKLFLDDFYRLNDLLQQQGFFGYPAATYGFPKAYSKDYIFELNDYYSIYLKATRENFSVKGTQRYAVLEFTNLEQRILTTNKIKRSIQEELLKWRDDYYNAEISRNPIDKLLVPPPTKNIWWQNVKLNTYKYFNGDDDKVLRWGLDLAGGKSVHIGLKNQDGKFVTGKEELKEGVNELYNRVNKMGVSEVSIRIEGSNIVLDFPGAQGLSAAELITSSSMTFHIVNEKFGSGNAELYSSVKSFLQEVWNESVVTNRQSDQEINAIAWRMLGGNFNDQPNLPETEAAKILYESGLQIASSEDPSSGTFNETLSSIATWRGDDVAQWGGSANPLVIVYHNYALEGASLEGVQTQYNPNHGNALSFRVSSSYGQKQGKTGNPQNDFYSWTSQFAEGSISGTNKEVYSNGRGWRMAILLNNKVISAPALGYPLRSNGEIFGNFTQREVSQLAADLKAGALSYTPEILSEQNISPELGKEERDKGIIASLLGLVLVLGFMIWYYRFSGVVASIAVLFNLFIMWGVLQNLGAALTLPGIAGIILTVGMAVDANVLVFERMREEFAISNRISSAIQIGYKKAFSAILDSNITTIIAAIILIQFDSGPIKGFAVTLIIGIVSSMFTALFMTRYFFIVWARRNTGKSLTMLNIIKSINFNFLAKSKFIITTSLILIVLGAFFLFTERHSMFGMDFTGGYGVTLNLEDKGKNVDYKGEITKALYASGVSEGEVELKPLNKANILQLQLSVAMDEEGGAFHQMPQIEKESEQALNPRLHWIITALKTNGVTLTQSSIVEANNTWTTVSGQLSDSMRTQALYGLGIAMLCILIYLSIRFEFKYAVSAIICLLHDVCVSLALLAILHFLGVPIQIDLQVIGAIMTIIGYSLNDTIIIFDRIREDVRLNRKLEFSVLVNDALNKTLSRTIITSLTTLIVLVALVLLGGSMIFDFSLIMAIGVVIGTLSSLFVASPMMIFLHYREEKKNSISTKNGKISFKKA
jgi:SecD/SecF fusion protein